MSKESSTEGDYYSLLLTEQKENLHRTDTEGCRRRMKREDLAEAEKRVRAEREQVRREVAEAAEERRQQDLEVARQLREKQRHFDAALKRRSSSKRKRANASSKKDLPWTVLKRISDTGR